MNVSGGPLSVYMYTSCLCAFSGGPLYMLSGGPLYMLMCIQRNTARHAHVCKFSGGPLYMLMCI